MKLSLTHPKGEQVLLSFRLLTAVNNTFILLYHSESDINNLMHMGLFVASRKYTPPMSQERPTGVDWHPCPVPARIRNYSTPTPVVITGRLKSRS